MFPSHDPIAQRRLKALTDNGVIKRNNQTLPYFYYIEKHAYPLERIAINWARLWLTHNLKSWERISMNYDTSTCTVLNTVTGVKKDIRIMEHGFKLPSDEALIISESIIIQWKERLLCGK